MEKMILPGTSGSLNKDMDHPWPNDPSYSDVVMDFMELIKERCFLGDIPFISIIERIQMQFEDYINLEDKTNYVDLFYTQLYLSYDRINNDDSEEHPNEIKEALNLLRQKFIDLIQSLFQLRLTISITDLEAGVLNQEDLEFIIRRLYEFFILGACDNFKIVISKDICSQIANIEVDDTEYFQRIQELMEGYNPLISTMTPTKFLQYRGEREINELYENGKISGNFLRKYTPKLYQNDEFVVEIVNHITMIHQFQKNVIDTDPIIDNTEIIDPPEIDNIPLDEPVETEENSIDLDGLDVSEDIAMVYNNEED